MSVTCFRIEGSFEHRAGRTFLVLKILNGQQSHLSAHVSLALLGETAETHACFVGEAKQHTRSCHMATRKPHCSPKRMKNCFSWQKLQEEGTALKASCMAAKSFFGSVLLSASMSSSAGACLSNVSSSLSGSQFAVLESALLRASMGSGGGQNRLFRLFNAD
jgi:hypothetical protein